MRILILHQHFNTPETGGALRSYFLAKALVDAGIQAVVVTAHNQPLYLKKDVEGIEVHYLPVPYLNSFTFTKRILAFLRFVMRSTHLASRLQVDRCYAMSTPLTIGLTALYLKWRKGLPFLFEVGDLWPDAPVQLGIIKNPILKFILYRLENLIYRQSSALVALSAPMQVALREKSPQKLVYLLPNMADLGFYQPSVKTKEVAVRLGVENQFVISYFGSVGFANGLEFYLDCARAVQHANLPVVFQLCGEGALLSSLKSTAQKLGISNLRFFEFRNRHELRELMEVSDAVFICFRPEPILETGSPNKYFDGLAAGKLILINFNGWIKEEIETHQCGFSISHRPEDLVKKLSPYLLQPEKLQKAQDHARALAKRYSRTQLSKVFVDIVTQ